jgi:hypothetical protein
VYPLFLYSPCILFIDIFLLISFSFTTADWNFYYLAIRTVILLISLIICNKFSVWFLFSLKNVEPGWMDVLESLFILFMATNPTLIIVIYHIRYLQSVLILILFWFRVYNFIILISFGFYLFLSFNKLKQVLIFQLYVLNLFIFLI